jgi:hypothetical protein
MDNLLVLENKDGFRANLNSDIVKEIYLSLKNRYNENKYSNDAMCAIACLGFTLLKDFDCILEEEATKKQDIERTKKTIKKLDYFFDNINKTDKAFEDLKRLDGLIEFYNNHNCKIHVFPINANTKTFLGFLMQIRIKINSRKQFKECNITKERIDINSNNFYVSDISINCIYEGEIKLTSYEKYSQNDIDYLSKRGVDIFYGK